MASEDQIEGEVMGMLPSLSASEMEAVCGVVDQEVGNDIKGNKKAVYKFLMKFLVDLTDDAPVLLLIHKHLNKDNKKEMPELEKSEDSATGIVAAKTTLDVMKLKDLKISGTIGGEKDKLSFTSLQYQIDTAKRNRYPDHAIIAAIIKVIAPGNYLRTYGDES